MDLSRSSQHLLRGVITSCVTLGLLACGDAAGDSNTNAVDTETETGAGGDGPMPNFALDDLNASSATFQRERSVEGELGRVSLWYFMHAT